MIIKADHNSYFVFDLDDTLYYEINFLKSAYSAIAAEISPHLSNELFEKMLEIYWSGRNTFRYLIEKFPERNMTVEKLLYLYRHHFPEISLKEGALDILSRIKESNGLTGIITDGRSITQRNKIKALGIEQYIDKLVISEEFGAEKPTSSLYESIMENEIMQQYYYIGDNLSKDFISPKKLGWCCIGILDEKNIRKQNLSDYSIEFLPHLFINNFAEIEII